MKTTRAFSVAEVILATALVAVCLLLVMALLISMLRGDRKAQDLGEAQLASETIVAALMDSVATDTPSGSKAAFWSTDAVAYRVGEMNANHTRFQYQIDLSTVQDTLGAPVGTRPGLTNNRLKQLSITVRWSQGPTATKFGSGRFECCFLKLVHEVP